MKEEINWEEVRVNAAIAAMQGICGNQDRVDIYKATIAEVSVKLADALIEELKK